MYVCETCGIIFEEDYRKDLESRKSKVRFCSRKCSCKSSASSPRIWTEEMRLTASQRSSCQAKKRKLKQELKRHKMVCAYCGSIFLSKTKGKTYCSRGCYLKDPNKRTHPGGYREGSGRSKSGYYKGVYCGSSWELVYLIYCLDHNIPVRRFSKKLSYGSESYFPDFINEKNEIIEIKGYYSSGVEKQIRVAEGNGYKIHILYYKDIEYMFKYVRETYSYTKLWDLYDVVD